MEPPLKSRDSHEPLAFPRTTPNHSGASSRQKTADRSTRECCFGSARGGRQGWKRAKSSDNTTEATIAHIETCLATVVNARCCAQDGHKGYAQPISRVVAYRDKISLSGVQLRHRCGNLAIRTDATGAQVAPAMATIMDDLVADISFGVGRSSKTRIDHDLFDDPAWRFEAAPGIQEDGRGAARHGRSSGGQLRRYFRMKRTHLGWCAFRFAWTGTQNGHAFSSGRPAGGTAWMCAADGREHRFGATRPISLAAMGLAGRYAYAGRSGSAGRFWSVLPLGYLRAFRWLTIAATPISRPRAGASRKAAHASLALAFATSAGDSF